MSPITISKEKNIQLLALLKNYSREKKMREQGIF